MLHVQGNPTQGAASPPPKKINLGPYANHLRTLGPYANHQQCHLIHLTSAWASSATKIVLMKRKRLYCEQVKRQHRLAGWLWLNSELELDYWKSAIPRTLSWELAWLRSKRTGRVCFTCAGLSLLGLSTNQDRQAVAFLLPPVFGLRVSSQRRAPRVLPLAGGAASPQPVPRRAASRSSSGRPPRLSGAPVLFLRPGRTAAGGGPWPGPDRLREVGGHRAARAA